MNENIPALSLQQPWLWAILNAGKRIENRNWGTRYRGRIRLHASRTWDEDGADTIRQTLGSCPSRETLFALGQLSAYLGEVTVIGCVRGGDFQPAPDQLVWSFGPWCWLLKDPIAYPEPIPGRGYPGLYDPEKVGQR